MDAEVLCPNTIWPPLPSPWVEGSHCKKQWVKPMSYIQPYSSSLTIFSWRGKPSLCRNFHQYWVLGTSYEWQKLSTRSPFSHRPCLQGQEAEQW